MTETPTRPLILLVDDDPVVRLTLARALTDRGYEVRTAADGQAAITILQGSGTLPAIAITDLQMTGGSGEELARVLARRYPDLPVIFITAYLARYRTAYLPGPILEKPLLVASYRGMCAKTASRANRVLSDAHFMFRGGADSLSSVRDRLTLRNQVGVST